MPTISQFLHTETWCIWKLVETMQSYTEKGNVRFPQDFHVVSVLRKLAFSSVMESWFLLWYSLHLASLFFTFTIPSVTQSCFVLWYIPHILCRVYFLAMSNRSVWIWSLWMLLVWIAGYIYAMWTTALVLLISCFRLLSVSYNTPTHMKTTDMAFVFCTVQFNYVKLYTKIQY